MGQKDMCTKDEAQRQQMIEFIVKIIQQTDDRKLRSIYNFILHIQ